MSRLAKNALFAMVLLLLCPCSLLAQRGGGGGGGRGGRGGSSGGAKGTPAESEEMKDFKNGIAMQASDQQVYWFLTMTKDTRLAKNTLENLAQHPDSAKAQAATLGSVLEKARGESHDFLENLTAPQKTGLKTFRKDVEKADSELEKTWKSLNQNLSHSKKDDSSQVTVETAKLEKALEKLSATQMTLGDKMGIQPPAEAK